MALGVLDRRTLDQRNQGQKTDRNAGVAPGTLLVETRFLLVRILAQILIQGSLVRHSKSRCVPSVSYSDKFPENYGPNTRFVFW